MCHLFHILQKTNNKHKQPVVHESTYLVNTNRKIVKSNANSIVTGLGQR